ncbi:MarR family transcriptional regulator [Rheinheimera sp.]|uniref:MarR family winged helix-turn-helix transcriptional regulator n=1 Tax=Rheinheimera sp. TaxID=1869214 RepID=UPI00307D1CA4
MSIHQQLFHILDLYKIALAQAFRSQQIALSPLHYKVLHLIQSLDPATPQLIAQHSGRDKAQVTRLLQDMEKQGLIEKQPHPHDKRSVCLALTKRAVTLCTQAALLVSQLDRQLSSQLTADEQQQLHQLLQKLAQGLTCPLKASSD